jgi:hypothetical protein
MPSITAEVLQRRETTRRAASVLRCPRYIRFAGNFGNAGLLLMAFKLDDPSAAANF